MLYGGNKGLLRALQAVEAISGFRSRSSEETQLIDFVLSQSTKDPVAVAQAITQVAVQHYDAPLWNHAVTLCCVDKGFATVSEDNIRQAISRLSLRAIKSGCASQRAQSKELI